MNEQAGVVPEDPFAPAAEAGIHRLAIPTPFAVGRVNVYLVEDEPLTLVDAGPNSGSSLDELQRGLAARGYSLEDLELVILTHQHIDHLGLVSIVAARSGADVAAIEAAVPFVERYSEEAQADDDFARDIMLRHGIPEDVVRALQSVSQAFRAWGAPAKITRVLRDGERIAFRDRELEVLFRPGHSPTDTVFYDPERRMLIAADHLLKHISSNPLLTRPRSGSEGGEDESSDPRSGSEGGEDERSDPRSGSRGEGEGSDPRSSGERPGASASGPSDSPRRPQALVTYLESLRKTRAMDVGLVLPGHGDPITDHRSLIDERFALHRRRAEKLRRLAAERPRTAYELAQELWGNIAVTQAYLTLSEVLGHTDVLLNEGRVRAIEEDGVVRFEAV